LLEFVCLAIITGLFFLPSLNHYYIAATPAAVLLAAKRGGLRYFAVAAALLLMHSLNILDSLESFSFFQGRKCAAAFDSIGISLLFACFTVAWTSGRSARSGRFRSATSVEILVGAPPR
jgi:hypothetical protein